MAAATATIAATTPPREPVAIKPMPSATIAPISTSLHGPLRVRAARPAASTAAGTSVAAR